MFIQIKKIEVGQFDITGFTSLTDVTPGLQIGNKPTMNAAIKEVRTIFAATGLFPFQLTLNSDDDAIIHFQHIKIESAESILENYLFDQSMCLASNVPDNGSRFEDYFIENVDYPKNIMLDILPINTQWNYVSSALLNGFINYVKIMRAYVGASSTKMDEIFSVENYGPFPDKNDSTKTIQYTKRDLFNYLTGSNKIHHSDLSAYQDNIFILARCQKDEKVPCDVYMFFVFDQDTSDCSIGRFQTSEPEDLIIYKFGTYVDNCATIITEDSQRIPEECIKGWVSF